MMKLNFLINRSKICKIFGAPKISDFRGFLEKG
jgi:hypothetical protein